MRDNFSSKTITNLARRVAFLCSNPDCRRHTVGPQAGAEGSINVGVAAHITAASVGGSRYDSLLRIEERRDASNGIWLCQTCSKLIDSDVTRFPVKLLREWKQIAEDHAFIAIAGSQTQDKTAFNITFELDETDRAIIQGLRLPSEDDIETVTSNIRIAANADIRTFKSSRRWPPHFVSLSMGINVHDVFHSVHIEGLAAATAITSEMVLIAAPGTGKTTLLVQLADTILSSTTSTAVFVPLAEWSSRSGDSFFQSFPRRKAYQAFKEQHFMLLAHHGRLVLLLDGWNELDPASRRRAVYELEALRRDYPLLCLVVTTRRQARDVPVFGPNIAIEALSEEQQLEIARAVRGDDGEALLDQAWRTPGIRELISIPLYLNALLTYATRGTMPSTKEEALRLFVKEHEASPATAEVLDRELLGFQHKFLSALAVEATQVANTTITDSRARLVISQVEDCLMEAGQIKTPPEPITVLDALVSQQTLIRSGTNGVSFQHQQFQEWYASFEVEALTLAAATEDVDAGKRLTSDALNMPAWEEAILFTCDRLSRNDETGAKAVAAAIIRTLSIDPILAAEMIFRASPAVWDLVKDRVVPFAFYWHKPNTVDRAARFMIATGQPEFASQIWPLVTTPDMQVQLSATRAARRFRPSVLGPDLQTRILLLSEEVRQHLVAEIAMESNIDGIELAAALAKADPCTSVKVAVIEALQFRGAHRFVLNVLNKASDAVWSSLAQKGYIDEIVDPKAVARLRHERQSIIEQETNIISKIVMLMDGESKDPAIARQVENLLESEDLPIKDDRTPWVLNRAFDRYPEEITTALLSRIQADRELPYWHECFLDKIPSIDEGVIPAIATDCSRKDRTADIAAVVIGPKTAGILIKKLLALDEKMQSLASPADQVIREEYHVCKDRISNSRTNAFLIALLGSSDTSDPHRICILADLISRHGKDAKGTPLQAEPELLESTAQAVQRWVDVLLNSTESNRHQFVSVVEAIKRIPREEFVEGLRCLLAQDLSRWQTARQEFFSRPVKGSVPWDVLVLYSHQYRSAFAAIGGDQVFQLMEMYLPEPQFGIDAAYVLREIWERQQYYPQEKGFRSFPDFSKVRERRRMQEGQGPRETSPHGEAIFKVVEVMARPECADDDQRHALQLAKIALSLPHGDKKSIIEKLLDLPRPVLEKYDLLVSLVLAGETICADTILDSLKALLTEAKQKPWLLDAQHNKIEDWVILLPFSDRPAALHDALALVDSRFKEPWRLRRLLSALGEAPDGQSEQLLKDLASRDPRFYSEYEWVAAVIARETPSSAEILLDLVTEEKLIGTKSGIDEWRLTRALAGIIRNCPKMRGGLIQRYEAQPLGGARSVLARVIAELNDGDGLLALIRGYAIDKRPFDGMLYHLVEELVLGKQPISQLSDNSYILYSVNSSDLRRRLFAMTEGNTAEARIAEACLTAIDELRDEHGRDDSEPRHPDIASARPWPILMINTPSDSRTFFQFGRNISVIQAQ